LHVGRLARRSAFQQYARVDAEEPHQTQYDQYAENPDATPAAAATLGHWDAHAAATAWKRKSEAATACAACAAPILDIVALSAAAPFHRVTSSTT
jgi:hypothetical protein